MQRGDIVTFWGERNTGRSMGVVIRINGNIITVQDSMGEQHNIQSDNVKHADIEDMIEELRDFYSF